MNSQFIATNKTEGSTGKIDVAGDIAIVGGDPSGLVLATALARRGIPSTVFERDVHPEVRRKAERRWPLWV
jgi:ribulose 1,5-bisphosphate synthetase/thiazole synthase